MSISGAKQPLKKVTALKRTLQRTAVNTLWTADQMQGPQALVGSLVGRPYANSRLLTNGPQPERCTVHAQHIFPGSGYAFQSIRTNVRAANVKDA
jgi:hypothetical protein